jgi:hypothetical protein
MGKVQCPLKPAVPWPAPAADDNPVMAAMAVDLGNYRQVLEQVRELLGLTATETGERTGS